MHGRHFLCAALALLLGGCELATRSSGVTIPGVSVRAVAGALILRNGRAEPVHYTALEAETATRTDLYFDPSGWPRVPPGSDLRLPITRLGGYHPDAREARVFLWTPGRAQVEVRVRLR